MGPVDAALQPLGLKREIVATVGGFSTALALPRSSELIATVPERHGYPGFERLNVERVEQFLR